MITDRIVEEIVSVFTGDCDSGSELYDCCGDESNPNDCCDPFSIIPQSHTILFTDSVLSDQSMIHTVDGVSPKHLPRGVPLQKKLITILPTFDELRDELGKQQLSKESKLIINNLSILLPNGMVSHIDLISPTFSPSLSFCEEPKENSLPATAVLPLSDPQTHAEQPPSAPVVEFKSSFSPDNSLFLPHPQYYDTNHIKATTHVPYQSTTQNNISQDEIVNPISSPFKARYSLHYIIATMVHNGVLQKFLLALTTSSDVPISLIKDREEIKLDLLPITKLRDVKNLYQHEHESGIILLWQSLYIVLRSIQQSPLHSNGISDEIDDKLHGFASKHGYQLPLQAIFHSDFEPISNGDNNKYQNGFDRFKNFFSSSPEESPPQKTPTTPYSIFNSIILSTHDELIRLGDILKNKQSLFQSCEPKTQSVRPQTVSAETPPRPIEFNPHTKHTFHNLSPIYEDFKEESKSNQVRHVGRFTIEKISPLSSPPPDDQLTRQLQPKLITTKQPITKDHTPSDLHKALLSNHCDQHNYYTTQISDNDSDVSTVEDMYIPIQDGLEHSSSQIHQNDENNQQHNHEIDDNFVNPRRRLLRPPFGLTRAHWIKIAIGSIFVLVSLLFIISLFKCGGIGWDEC
jgi:hypothetical protein